MKSKHGLLELRVTAQVSCFFVQHLALQHIHLNFMQPSHASEAKSSSACQEILYILWTMPFPRQLFPVPAETQFDHRHSDIPV
jgi:hypothetical protein